MACFSPARHCWSEAKLWIEKDDDGITQPNELYSLDQMGIESISLNYAGVNEVDPFSAIRHANARLSRSTVGKADGGDDHRHLVQHAGGLCRRPRASRACLRASSRQIDTAGVFAGAAGGDVPSGPTLFPEIGALGKGPALTRRARSPSSRAHSDDSTAGSCRQWKDDFGLRPSSPRPGRAPRCTRSS